MPSGNDGGTVNAVALLLHPDMARTGLHHTDHIIVPLLLLLGRLAKFIQMFVNQIFRGVNILDVGDELFNFLPRFFEYLWQRTRGCG